MSSNDTRTIIITMAEAKPSQSQSARTKAKRLSTSHAATRMLALSAFFLVCNPLLAQGQPASPTGTRPVFAGAATDTQRWISVEGESIVSMAQAMFPRDEASRSFFISRVLRANPGLLRRGYDAHSPLPTGTELLIPSLVDLANAASTLPTTLRRPPEARLPEASQQVVPSRPTVSSTPESEILDRDRLVIDTGGRDELARELLQGQSTTTVTEREARLVAAIDRNIDLQRELLERIKRLEEVQNEIERRLNEPLVVATAAPASPVAVSASDGTAPQVAAPPPPNAESVAPQGTVSSLSRGWLNWALAAIVVLLLLLLLTQRYRLRRQSYHSYRENPDEDIWPDEAIASAGFEPQGRAQTSAAERKSVGNPPATRPLSSAKPTSGQHTPPGASGKPAAPKQARPAAVPVTDALLEADTLPPASPVKDLNDETLDDTPTQPPTLQRDDEPEEDVSAVELADLMMGFGRVDGAADALEAFLENNPRAAVKPWLKLTEVYHKAGKREEFETVAARLHHTFNVELPDWNAFARRTSSSGLESMPHITERLEAIWGTRECQAYIDTLTRDNRQGTRTGFKLDVLDDLLMLASVLDAQLGGFRSKRGIRN